MQIDTTKLTALIDADILVYHSGFSADSQVRREFVEKNPGASKDATDKWIEELQYASYAITNVKAVIHKLQSIFSKDVKLYLTGSGNFREQLATIREYKGNRVDSNKPKYYGDITDYLVHFWDAQVINGREADDALGCAQWSEWIQGNDSTVIVSIDKDLDNIPGYHYNWRKEDLYYVDIGTADQHFWKQVITGDAVDNIQGIPGAGPKAADKLIGGTSDWVEMYDIVRNAYLKKGYTEENFHENATLAWIQRVEGTNYDDKPYDLKGISHEQ